MRINDTTALLTYINGLDPLITINPARIEAWQSFLPDHITYPKAKAAVDYHYANNKTSVKPKDILDFVPKTPIYEEYKGGKKSLCGNCHDGYTITPLPPNSKGYIFNDVDLCDCQWDGPPRETPNPEYITRRQW